MGGFAEIIQELCNENKILHQQVSSAIQVKQKLANIRATPPQLWQTAQKIWHQRANDIIGAEHSSCAPTRKYGCAHDGCTVSQSSIS